MAGADTLILTHSKEGVSQGHSQNLREEAHSDLPNQPRPEVMGILGKRYPDRIEDLELSFRNSNLARIGRKADTLAYPHHP